MPTYSKFNAADQWKPQLWERHFVAIKKPSGRDKVSLSQRPHSKDLRKGRSSIAGQAYMVTTCTQDRKPIFANFDAARQLIQTLAFEQNRQTATTLAFVVMPDHLHWLLSLGQSKSLSAVVQAVKTASAKRIGWPVWQDGFHDHAVREEEDVKHLARYIIANPLRAGLVEKIGDYPHWDAIWF